MVEETYFIGEEIKWKNLSAFRDRCNTLLGRNAIVSVGSDGWISAINLTASEIEIIQNVNQHIDILDEWETSKFRHLTLAQADAFVDNISNLTQAKDVIKKLARIVLWLAKKEDGSLG